MRTHRNTDDAPATVDAAAFWSLGKHRLIPAGVIFDELKIHRRREPVGAAARTFE